MIVPVEDWNEAVNQERSQPGGNRREDIQEK